MANDKLSFVCSLLLHILLLWAIFSVRNIHILVPARSNGMEVNLVAYSEITPPQPPAQVVAPIAAPQNSIVSNSPQQINLPQQPQPLKTAPPKTQTITNIKTKPTPPRVNKPLKPKKHLIPNTQLNDLLSDLHDENNNIPKHTSNANATGGINAGSANTKVMVANYADSVIALLRPLINIPYDINSNNIAIFKVTLLPNMQVYKVQLIKPSGNPSYDDNIRDAINNKIAAFPPLPTGAKFVDYRQLVLTFQPE